MMLDRPDKNNQLLEGSPWNGHYSYACITPEVHLPYMDKIDMMVKKVVPRLNEHEDVITPLPKGARV